MKNIMVVTHERSGTHLVINIINIENNGDFKPIGKLPPSEHNFDLETYKFYADFMMLNEYYQPNIVFKSHHQVEYFEKNIDKLFEKYYVVYVERDIKDVLISYYKFLNGVGFDKNGKSLPIKGFPKFPEWIFRNPAEVGYRYFEKYPDPHIYVEPIDYVDRYVRHWYGWMRYKDRFLTVYYEDVLNNYEKVKNDLENFLHKKVSDSVPNIHNKDLPNFSPNKGIVGSHKKVMDEKLIEKVEKRKQELLDFYKENYVPIK
jgi:hypothetical protein